MKQSNFRLVTDNGRGSGIWNLECHRRTDLDVELHSQFRLTLNRTSNYDTIVRAVTTFLLADVVNKKLLMFFNFNDRALREFTYELRSRDVGRLFSSQGSQAKLQLH